MTIVVNNGLFTLNDAYTKAVGNDWPAVSAFWYDPLVLDDISSQFDGTKNVFTLTVNASNVSTVINNTIKDSKDVEVNLNGLLLSPYVEQSTLPWLTPYDAYKGFRIVGDSIVFYTAPAPGSQCTMIIRKFSQTKQVRKANPFTTKSIALGD